MEHQRLQFVPVRCRQLQFPESLAVVLEDLAKHLKAGSEVQSQRVK